MMRQTQFTPGQLQLRLGLVFALAVSVGNIIGSGIMRTPGLVADQVPVPWQLVALWALGGLHTLLLANIAAELATSLPKAGGTFVSVRAAMGDALGMLSGWSEWLARVASIAALSVACANFLKVILPGTTDHPVPVAATFAAAIFAINWAGVREGQAAQVFSSVLKVGLIAAVIVVAFASDPHPVSAAAPVTPPAIAPGGLLAYFAAYQLIYGAYAGWQAPIYFVEEDARAARNIPRALALSVVVVTIIYLALNLSLFNALDMTVLRSADLPVALVIEQAFGRSGGMIVALIAILIVVGALNAMVMSSPRILFGMARDGLFLHHATRVNRGGTPDVAMAITTVLTFMLIASGSFVFLFKLMAALASFVFLLYASSLFVLRRTQPELHRPFRTIGYPVLPALAWLTNLALLVAFIIGEPISGVYMIGLIALCVPVGMMLQRRRLAMMAGQ